jgi:hypothetical protein
MAVFARERIDSLFVGKKPSIPAVHQMNRRSSSMALYRVTNDRASEGSGGQRWSLASLKIKKSSASLNRQSSEVRTDYNISYGSNKS